MKLNNSGQILVEVLIAMAIASVVVVLGSQLVFVSLSGNKISGDSNIASGLVEETVAAAQAVAAQNWFAFYSLNHGGTQYYPQKSGGAWVITAGSENITLNSIYTRYFTLQNVCRDISTKLIAGVSDAGGSASTCNDTPGARLDPSTQKINVFVSWPGGAGSVGSDYITRWRNKACLQTVWSSAGSGVYDCPSSFFGSTDGNIIVGDNLHL